MNGKVRNFQRRKYCLTCSPFGSGNTAKLEKKGTKKKGTKPKSEKYLRWQRKARRERKEKLIRLLGEGCKECGYNKCIAALDFHHPDPSKKKFSLASQGLLRKWSVVVKEAKKCHLLCRNCHAEHHYEE